MGTRKGRGDTAPAEPLWYLDPTLVITRRRGTPTRKRRSCLRHRPPRRRRICPPRGRSSRPFRRRRRRACRSATTTSRRCPARRGTLRNRPKVRDSSPRKIHVADAAAPRPFRARSTSQPRPRRDPSLEYPRSLCTPSRSWGRRRSRGRAGRGAPGAGRVVMGATLSTTTYVQLGKTFRGSATPTLRPPRRPQRPRRRRRPPRRHALIKQSQGQRARFRSAAGTRATRTRRRRPAAARPSSGGARRRRRTSPERRRDVAHYECRGERHRGGRPVSAASTAAGVASI